MERGGDLPGDILLKVEDVGELRVIILRPELPSVIRAGEPCRDAHAVAHLPCRSLDEIGRIQRLTDGAQIAIGRLEPKSRGTGDDVKAAHAGERRGDFIGQPVGEEILARLAGIPERQHRNADACGGRRLSRCRTKIRAKRERGHGQKAEPPMRPSDRNLTHVLASPSQQHSQPKPSGTMSSSFIQA